MDHRHCEPENHHQYTQSSAGRPGKDTQYVRKTRERFGIHWQMCGETFAYDDRTDGIFPLMTNDESLSVREALAAYKRQPALEKRHEQLKTVFAVMPVNLKSHSRIEAFLFLYFVALLVESLIERELHRRMKTQNLESLPLYPEGRRCRPPPPNGCLISFAMSAATGSSKPMARCINASTTN